MPRPHVVDFKGEARRHPSGRERRHDLEQLAQERLGIDRPSRKVARKTRMNARTVAAIARRMSGIGTRRRRPPHPVGHGTAETVAQNRMPSVCTLMPPGGRTRRCPRSSSGRSARQATIRHRGEIDRVEASRTGDGGRKSAFRIWKPVDIGANVPPFARSVNRSRSVPPIKKPSDDDQHELAVKRQALEAPTPDTSSITE